MAGSSGGRGRCSVSRMQRRTTGSSGPCAPPSSTGATASGTHRRRSPRPHTSSDAGDGCAPPSQVMDTRGWGRTSDAKHHPGRTWPPDPEHTPHPATIWRGRGARAASSRGESGGNECGGGPTAPQPAKRYALTQTGTPSTRRPPPPANRHHAVRGRQLGEQGAQGRGPAPLPSARRVEGGSRRVRPPPSTAGPPGTGSPGRPPRSRRGVAPRDGGGTTGSPPLPPPAPSPRLSPPRPADSRRLARGTAAPHPPRRARGGNPRPGRATTPRGGRHCRGKCCCTPSASSQPPAYCRGARGRPAALRRRSRAPRGPQQDGGTRT